MVRSGSHRAASPKLLLIGPPRRGKSTAVARFVQLAMDSGVPVAGFVTDELREGGRRVGFVVRDLAGPEAVLAHQDADSQVRVGRYGVDVAAFERVGLPALARAALAGGVVVVDEIARMELVSQAFAEAVRHIFDGSSPVVATVHEHRHPFTDALKRRNDVELIALTAENRDAIPGELLARVIR